MKRKSVLCLMLAIVMLLCVLPAGVFAADTGSVRITTNPDGADVYVDGVRYLQRTTPCTVPLNAGEHEISLRIPGYEEYSETFSVAAGKETEITRTLLPALPDEDGMRTITVTAETDTEPEDSLTYEQLSGSVSLRQALTAAQNDGSGRWYRIEFAGGVNRIELTGHIVEYSRDNLIINGDRDRDGAPDVTLTMTYWSLLFRPMKNLILAGLTLDGENGCAVAIRPDDNGLTDVSYENINLLGCRFTDCEIIPFCGACKVFNSSGRVNYTGIYACGNELIRSNLFFGYSGNTDNSVTDGLYYCANKLDKDSVLTVMCSDCNTNYIYGGDNEESNGGTPGAFESSDYNTVKNVLVSGNTGGSTVFGTSCNGNSYNTIKDVLIRNNYFTSNLHFRPCQPIDERNKGNRLSMTGNRLENVTLEYNVLDFRENDNFIYLTILAFDTCDPSTYYVLKDNLFKNFTMRNNLYLGSHEDGDIKIEDGIGYSLVSGMVPVHAMIYMNDEGNNFEAENNRFEGLTFDGNRKVESYDPYAPWDGKPQVKVSDIFTDVKAGSWYESAVQYAYDNGLFSGMSPTTFAPNATMTRAMLVTVLYRMEGSPEATGVNKFTDVKAGQWYTDAVTWAADNGIVSGMSPTIFNPNGNITREQMASILFRYTQFKDRDVSARADLSKFKDGNKVSGWAKEAMSWANAEGLITGTGVGLEPTGNATRAQVASILMRYCQKY